MAQVEVDYSCQLHDLCVEGVQTNQYVGGYGSFAMCSMKKGFATFSPDFDFEPKLLSYAGHIGII